MKMINVWLVAAPASIERALQPLAESSRCRFAACSLDEALSGDFPWGNVDLLVVCHATQRDSLLVQQLLQQASGRRVPSIVVMEQHSPETALLMLQNGAVDCLSRPLNIARLAFLFDILTVRSRVTQIAAATVPSEPIAASEQSFVYRTPAMRMLLDGLRLAARSDSTVLLTGETGTGKTHLSRLLHDMSPRRGKPFVVVNCGALSSTLLESELFGHMRGAFTGADRDYVGRLARAGEGTLLLDEVDSLTPEAQAKLLRAVEEREFEAIGSEVSQRFKARLVVATNRSLEPLVAERKFRSDLYYRLNVVSFHTPALRDRPDDVEALAKQFLAERVASQDCLARSFAPDALASLRRYSWPGNVRELRNTIERLAVLCPHARIETSHLPLQLLAEQRVPVAVPAHRAEVPGNQLAKARFEAEQGRLIETLVRNQDNRSVTAAELGISRTALYKKLKKYHLQ